MKNEVESTNKYPHLEKRLNSIGLLNLIKRLVYTGGTNDLNTRQKMNLHQDRL